jgi:hypothetical protein
MLVLVLTLLPLVDFQEVRTTALLRHQPVLEQMPLVEVVVLEEVLPLV